MVIVFIIVFFRDSVIESTTLPISLILEQYQLPIVIGNVQCRQNSPFLSNIT